MDTSVAVKLFTYVSIMFWVIYLIACVSVATKIQVIHQEKSAMCHIPYNCHILRKLNGPDYENSQNFHITRSRNMSGRTALFL